MRILIEHIVFKPYTGAVTGGSERSTQLAAEALRARGHAVSLVVPADSTGPGCILSPASSAICGRLDMRLWYDFMAEISTDYDAVLLNHPLTSPTIFSTPAEFLRKCTYINRNGSAWYVSGNAGMRLMAHLKLLRHVGGRTLYLTERNRDALQAKWASLDKAKYAASRAPAAGKRLMGSLDFLQLDFFDGGFDEAIFPPDAAPTRAGEGYVVSVGPPDSEKRLHLAAELAKTLGRHHFIFSTTPADEKEQASLAKAAKAGSEIFLDAPHGDIMNVLAGADALLLASRNETYCHVAMEAIAHGVPVMALEVPPALDNFAELTLPWDAAFETTTEQERGEIQGYLRETYSLDALGTRLERCLFPDRFFGSLEKNFSGTLKPIETENRLLT